MPIRKSILGETDAAKGFSGLVTVDTGPIMGDFCICPDKMSKVDSNVCTSLGGAGSDRLGRVLALNSASDRLWLNS